MRRAPSLVVLAMALFAVHCASSETASDDDGGSGGGLLTGAGGGASTSTSASHGSTSSSASTSGAGAGGAGGSGGEPPACPDPSPAEQNESESTAYALFGSSIDDCDSSGSSIQGVIAGDDDVDWYTYIGDDSFGCVVDPARVIAQSQSGLRLCKFFRCVDANAATEFSCPALTNAATSPEGRAGCCGSFGFGVSDLNCTGSTDDIAEVFIRVDQPGATPSTCNSYTLDFHY
jgi:hypothetical protein